MTHQHIRLPDPGAVEQLLEVLDLVGGVVDARHREAVAEPGAVIGTCPREVAELWLNAAPSAAAVPEARFQYDRRNAGAHAVQVQAAAATDGDELARANDPRVRARGSRRRDLGRLLRSATAHCQASNERDREHPAKHTSL